MTDTTTTVEDATITRKNRPMIIDLFTFQADSVYWALQIVSLVLVGATVFAGGAAIIAGIAAGQKQSETILKLQTDLAEAKTKQAEAEAGLQLLRKLQEPRTGAVTEILKGLKDTPPGKAEILYQDGDGEAYMFASFLRSALTYSKWEVSEPRPIGDTISSSYSGIPRASLQEMSPPMRLGASPTGVSIVTNAKTMRMGVGRRGDNPYVSLLLAFASASIRLGNSQNDEALPDGFLRIVIAPR